MTKYQSYKSSGVEWIGEIPENWSTKRLSYSFGIKKGKIPNNLVDEFSDDTLPYLSMDVLRGNIPNEFSDDSNVVVVEEGDLGILWDGSNSGEIIKINRNGILSSTVSLLSIIDKDLDKDFGYYLLKIYENHFRKNTIGMGIPHVNGNYIRETKLIFPPFKVQRQIVQFLDEKTELIDKLISTKERKIILLKEQRISLINQVVTKGLNPYVKMKESGFDLVGDIPEGWNMYRVSNLGTFFKGSGIKKDEVKEEGIPCIRYGEIYTKYDRIVYKPNSFIDFETSLNSVEIKKGDLLFTGSGETLVDIGKSLLYYGEENIFVGGDIIVMRIKTGISPVYLSYLMNTSFIQFQKSQLGRGEIIVHIYSKNIKEIRTPLPPIDEQNQIVEYLDLKTKEIDDMVSLELKKIDLLKEYRKSLISEVVTGKIKVTNDE
jgi:type I restriction enzyme S subunit